MTRAESVLDRNTTDSRYIMICQLVHMFPSFSVLHEIYVIIYSPCGCVSGSWPARFLFASRWICILPGIGLDLLFHTSGYVSWCAVGRVSLLYSSLHVSGDDVSRCVMWLVVLCTLAANLVVGFALGGGILILCSLSLLCFEWWEFVHLFKIFSFKYLVHMLIVGLLKSLER